jgi:hypothetical protein
MRSKFTCTKKCSRKVEIKSLNAKNNVVASKENKLLHLIFDVKQLANRKVIHMMLNSMFRNPVWRMMMKRQSSMAVLELVLNNEIPSRSYKIFVCFVAKSQAKQKGKRLRMIYDMMSLDILIRSGRTCQDQGLDRLRGSSA